MILKRLRFSKSIDLSEIRSLPKHQRKGKSMNMSELKASALESAKWRGHLMGKWENGPKYSTSECLKCGALVTVNTNPAPNEIDMCGEAVALSCEK